MSKNSNPNKKLADIEDNSIDSFIIFDVGDTTFRMGAKPFSIIFFDMRHSHDKEKYVDTPMGGPIVCNEENHVGCIECFLDGVKYHIVRELPIKRD